MIIPVDRTDTGDLRHIRFNSRSAAIPYYAADGRRAQGRR